MNKVPYFVKDSFDMAEYQKDRVEAQQAISKILNTLGDKYGYQIRVNTEAVSNIMVRQHNHYVQLSIVI